MHYFCASRLCENSASAENVSLCECSVRDDGQETRNTSLSLRFAIAQKESAHSVQCVRCAGRKGEEESAQNDLQGLVAAGAPITTGKGAIKIVNFEIRALI